MTISYVCIFCTFMAIPTLSVCLMVQNNFDLSITMLALKYIFSEGWEGPSITMIVNAISPENKGLGVSAFLFCSIIMGTVALYLLGYLEDKYDAYDHEYLYG